MISGYGGCCCLVLTVRCHDAYLITWLGKILPNWPYGHLAVGSGRYLIAGEAMTEARHDLTRTGVNRTFGRRPVTWNGGAAMVVDEDAAIGAFSTVPNEHYIQIALGTGGGRHVCGWNGRHVFDGDYRDGLMSVTPAGHTLHGECQAPWRKALIVKVKPRFVSQVAQDMGFARENIIPAIDQTDNLLLQLAHAVAAECEAGVPHGTLYAETAATLLSLYLLRQNAGTAPLRPQPVRGGLAPYVLRRVTELIESRLGEDISLLGPGTK
jgi:hypothetical protein